MIDTSQQDICFLYGKDVYGHLTLLFTDAQEVIARNEVRGADYEMWFSSLQRTPSYVFRTIWPSLRHPQTVSELDMIPSEEFGLSTLQLAESSKTDQIKCLIDEISAVETNSTSPTYHFE